MAFSSVGLVIGEFFWPRFQIGLDDFTVPKVITGFFFTEFQRFPRNRGGNIFGVCLFSFLFFLFAAAGSAPAPERNGTRVPRPRRPSPSVSLPSFRTEFLSALLCSPPDVQPTRRLLRVLF